MQADKKLFGGRCLFQTGEHLNAVKRRKLSTFKTLMENFQNVFTVRAHGQNTRNNVCLLAVPKIKLQVVKSNFRSMSVKNYND